MDNEIYISFHVCLLIHIQLLILILRYLGRVEIKISFKAFININLNR